MRSFLGRDILSLKDMEREEYFQIFSVADRLKPYAAEAPQRGAPQVQDAADRLLPAEHQDTAGDRGRHAPPRRRTCSGFSDAKMTRAGDFYQESIKDTVHMLEYYGDVIAMRHFQAGSAGRGRQVGLGPGHQLRRRVG